jgi:phosphoribosylamine-glycine ligase
VYLLAHCFLTDICALLFQLPLLESDLYTIFLSCTQGALHPELVRWKEHSAACTVVCAQRWYPSGARPPSTDPPLLVTGLDGLPHLGHGDSLQVYHAGMQLVDVSRPEEGAVATGGRVLAVTGLSSTLQEARHIAYEGVKEVLFQGVRYRSDIGQR